MKMKTLVENFVEENFLKETNLLQCEVDWQHNKNFIFKFDIEHE